MNRAKQKQKYLNMEVINKPEVAYTKKSMQFFLNDWRKVIAAAVLLFLPLLNNLWRLFPENVSNEFYGTLQVFVWMICVHLMILLLGVSLYFYFPEKDKVLRFISLSVIAYGVLLSLQVLEFSKGTPLLLDIALSGVIFAGLYLCLQYIQKNYLNKPNDYKTLHDGLVYDLHHRRFLGSINRVAGLIEAAEMEEPYKCLCAQEIDELKKSIAYIAEKYEALN